MIFVKSDEVKDLIDEKDFLQEPYNPSRLFYTFYAISFVQLLLFIAILYLVATPDPFTVGVAAFLLPAITVLSMFFFSKKNMQLPIIKLAKACFIIFAVFYTPGFVAGILRLGFSTVAIYISVVTLNYLLSVGIIFIVLRVRGQNRKGRPAGNSRH